MIIITPTNSTLATVASATLLSATTPVIRYTTPRANIQPHFGSDAISGPGLKWRKISEFVVMAIRFESRRCMALL
ncbi:hypothetical protein [Bradyrhizobium iriomotense]|uniref:Secreted protein n=1 Tax=Bradyrhizobium iriomotense TaxID=441950 RepID=A0ABQ6BDV2_9BRAD|nr:hypothetical protein GCM10007857_78060 [Bradyrhizobium iriomotense]